MPITFADLPETSYRHRMYIIEMLEWFAGSGVAPPHLQGAIRGGCLSMPNPPKSDPKLVSVMSFSVEQDESSRATYTMLFSNNAKFYRLVTTPANGAGSGGYTLLSFDTLSAGAFADAVIATGKAFEEANAFRQARQNEVAALVARYKHYQLGDDLPTVGNPINRPALPSGGLDYGKTPGEQTYGMTPGDGNYGKTPGDSTYAKTPGNSTYAQTPGSVGAKATKTGAARRVSSLRKMFGA